MGHKISADVGLYSFIHVEHHRIRLQFINNEGLEGIKFVYLQDPLSECVLWEDSNL